MQINQKAYEVTKQAKKSVLDAKHLIDEIKRSMAHVQVQEGHGIQGVRGVQDESNEYSQASVTDEAQRPKLICESASRQIMRHVPVQNRTFGP